MQTQTDPASPVRLTPWEKEPSVLELKEDLAMAQPSHDEHVSKVNHWLNIRNVQGEAKPKARPNRSQLQPRLVRRQNEWRYAPLSEPFLSTSDMVKVTPSGWEDVKGAEQNHEVVKWQFRTKINSVRFFDSFVRATVDEGTCYVRVGWVRETETVDEETPVWEYIQATDERIIQQIQSAIQMKMENPQGFSELPLDVQKGAEFSLENQIPAYARQVGVTVSKVEKVRKNHPTLEIVHYENVYIDPTCEGDLDKARFVILSFTTSKAELLRDGRYKNLDKVNWSSNEPLSNPQHNPGSSDPSVQFKDESRKRVVAYEYWGSFDIDGSGTLRPIVATWIGSTMIRMEENPYPDEKPPLVMVPYMPVLRSLHGEPDAELLEDNQKVMGAVSRGMIDLLAKSANSQTGFAKGFLDAVNKQRYNSGSDYEFNPSLGGPEQSIHMHKYPEIPVSAMNMLMMHNQEAESMTGVKAFSGGLSGEAYGDVAAGIRGMLDAASKREMSILRRLAQGYMEIVRKIITMNQVFLSDEEIIRVTNDAEVKRIRRDDLAGNYDLEVDISSAEVDQAKAQDLGFMLQTMGPTMPFEMTKSILVQIAKLKKMHELAHQLETYQPQPDPVQQKTQELELAKLEAEIQRINSQAALDQARAEKELADARKSVAEARLTDLDTIEQETGTKHLRDLDRMQSQARGNSELEVTKRLLNSKPEEQGSKERDVKAAIGYQRLAPALTAQ